MLPTVIVSDISPNAQGQGQRFLRACARQLHDNESMRRIMAYNIVTATVKDAEADIKKMEARWLVWPSERNAVLDRENRYNGLMKRLCGAHPDHNYRAQEIILQDAASVIEQLLNGNPDEPVELAIGKKPVKARGPAVR